MDKVYGILGIATKAGKIVSGFDSVVDCCKKNQVNLVIVANDISEKSRKEIKFVCDKYQVQLINFGDIETNSHSIGKQNRAIIGVCDKGFSKRILELIND